MQEKIRKIFIIGTCLIVAIIVISVYYCCEYFDNIKKPRLISPIAIEERFNEIASRPGMSGEFHSFDPKENIIYINMYDRVRSKVIAKPFLVDEQTIFSKKSEKYDQAKILTKEDMAKERAGARVVFYADATDEGEQTIKMIQIADFEPFPFPDP